MDRFDDESLCLRCGRCCREKIRAADGTVVFTDIPCAFLDGATNLCRAYADRFRRQPRCSSARASAAIGALPHDCPYVADWPEYPKTATLAERPELRPWVAELFPGAKRRKPRRKT